MTNKNLDKTKGRVKEAADALTGDNAADGLMHKHSRAE
jgi:uncharacterized protein YjbJ (UPF0337 family)